MVLKWIKAITEWLCRFPRLRREYIEVGGLKWALENAGTDAENPNGKLYTWDEAMELEDETWRLPTDEELDEFIERTFFGFDKKRGVGIFVDRETNARLELHAVGYRNTSGSLNGAGTWGYYWSSVANGSYGAGSLYFGSSTVGVYSNYNKRYGFSVRCVRRCPLDVL